jgi:hypothetical protein
MFESTYNYSDQYGEQQRSAGNLLGGLALLAMLFCVINCVIPELEEFLTGGRVPIPQAFVKMGAFCFLGLLTLIYGRLDLAWFPIKTWTVGMGYLLLIFPFLWFVERKQPEEILLAYNAAYCPIIFAPLATAVRGKLSERWAMRIFMGVFAASAILGWAQFVLQDPIVQLASSDGNFRIFASAWSAGGPRSIRSTSFFGSALDYGGFVVLVAAIGIGMCGKRESWKKGLLLYLVAAATCYTTATRNVFIQFFFATVAGLILTFGRKSSRLRWLPFLALGLALVIAFSGVSKQISNQIGDKKSIGDDSSLDQRLLQWGKNIAILEHSSTAEQLFGLGFSQADKPVIVAANEQWSLGDALVDNEYLALVLHIGLVGAFLIGAVIWQMWRFVRNEAIDRPTPLIIGIASFWSTFLMTAMFNSQAALYGFWFLIAVIIIPRGGDRVEREAAWAEDVEDASEFEPAEAVAP